MNDRLRAIAAKASSIHERLTPDFVSVDDGSHEELVEARMRAWRLIAANGDEPTFQARLAWDGLDENLARRAVGPVRLRSDAPLPVWASTLREVLRLMSVSRERDRCLEQREPIPFEEVLIPFVLWARSACERKAGSAYQAFPDLAHTTLERQLLESLSAHASRSLSLELAIQVSVYESPLDRLLESEPSRTMYNAFVANLVSGGLISFFEEYSVLARVLATTTELWVEATVEMLQRFRADAHAIRAMLGVRDILRVTNVASWLSDPHHGLRSVAILTFDSGQRVVYKPRGLAIEAGWNALLDSLGAPDAPVTFRTFQVLDRGEYGWAEFVEYATCKNDEEAQRYFVRAGALLCVVHLLYGTDCHGDNIISAGEHPILIDVESMLSPQTRDPAIGAEAPRLARKRLTGSVLNTYLLPFWAHSIGDGVVFDGSGFGADLEQDRSAKVERWIFVNTDRIKLARETDERIPPPRASMADGRPLRVYEYEAELVSGFEAMYRFMIHEKAALLSPANPFQRLRNVQVRFVHRHTSLYCLVLGALKKPDLCRDGVDRSIQIEQLALAQLIHARYDDRSGWMDMWNEERKCIERGDVPQFSALAGDDSLYITPDLSISGWFAQAGHAAAVERLNSFDEIDLAFQVDLIRSSLRSRAPMRERLKVRGPVVLDSPTTVHALESMAGDDSACVTEAITIAQALARDAIWGNDGSVSWLQPPWSRDMMLAVPRRELDVVGHDLYDGAVGIGLFLAGVERVSNRSGLRALAIGAVRPLLVELQERGEETAEPLGIGGMSGLGSIVYGLVQMSTLLGEPELLAGAERAAALLAPKRIDADLALDVTLGSAGALLGLLTLYEANGSRTALAGAIHCGRRIVDRLEPAGPGLRAVRTLQGRFLSGFAHGAAGIAYALGRLHRVTGDPSLLKAARELVEFERSTFSVEHNDWPDLRHSGPPRFMAAWCHGAPGIALGRMASLENMDDQKTRWEIDRALAITQAQGAEGADYLCCGSFGGIEILSTAGRLLGRPELHERARLLAHQIMRRSVERGEYVLGLPSAGYLACRGLFQGLPGIGYALLRLARPDVLPEVLLLR